MTALLRALIVDPDDVHRMLVQRTLNEAGFECVHAHDGIMALQFASELGIDLIVCSLNLPRLSGSELLSLRQRGVFGRAPPAIVFADRQDDFAAGLAAADCCITFKPASHRELHDALEKLATAEAAD